MRTKPHVLGEAVDKDRVDLRRDLLSDLAVAGAAEADLLNTLRRCDDAELWRVDGARNIAEWTAAWTGWSQWKARRVVAAAHALTSLPVISSTHRAGALALDKVVELTRFATPETEEGLVRWARGVTAARVRERAEEEAGRELAEALDAHESRNVQMYSSAERWYLEAQLPLEQGVAVEQAIRGLAKDLPRSPKEEHEIEADYKRRTMQHREADAFVQLVTGNSPSATTPETTLTLHAPIETLAQDDGAISFGGGLLHSETVRRLSCDCRVQLALENENRDPIGIGRKSRNIPDWLRQAVLYRDGHRCTFPGCESRADLVGHHIQHWGRMGPTEIENLCSVCPLHHFYVHEGGWSVILQGERTMWFRPSGRIYDPGAPPPEEISEPEPSPVTYARAAGYSRLFELIPRERSPAQPPEPDLLRAAKRRRQRERQLLIAAVVR